MNSPGVGGICRDKEFLQMINRGGTKLANEIFENSTYFYRVVGKFTSGGKVAKYFG